MSLLDVVWVSSLVLKGTVAPHDCSSCPCRTKSSQAVSEDSLPPHFNDVTARPGKCDSDASSAFRGTADSATTVQAGITMKPSCQGAQCFHNRAC